MPEKKKRPFKKGYWVICRYSGENGDLIAGRVESVRTNGKVLLTNLLTGALATKDANTLLKRNLVVNKATTDKVVAIFEAQGKKEARAAAVRLSSALLADNSPQQTLQFNSKRADGIIKAFRALSKAEQVKVSRALWGSVLELFGVG